MNKCPEGKKRRLIKWSLVNHWSTDKLLEEVKKYSDREIAASEIIGRTIISRSLLNKYFLLSPNTIAVQTT
jgi:hypothetical protein